MEVLAACPRNASTDELVELAAKWDKEVGGKIRFGLIESAGRYGVDLNIEGPGLVKALDEIGSDDDDDIEMQYLAMYHDVDVEVAAGLEDSGDAEDGEEDGRRTRLWPKARGQQGGSGI